MVFKAISTPGDGNCLFHSIIEIAGQVEFDYRNFPGLLLPRPRAVKYLRGLAAEFGKRLPPDELGDVAGLAATIQELPHMGAWANSYYAFSLCLRVLRLSDVGIVAMGRVYQPSRIGVYLACSGGHFWVEIDEAVYRKPQKDTHRLEVLRSLKRPPEALKNHLATYESG